MAPPEHHSLTEENPMIRRTVFTAAVLLVLPVALSAQGTLTTQRIGDYRYTSGQIGGQSVYGTTTSIGNYSYSNLQVGRTSVSGTSTTIGSYQYSNWSNGYSANATQVGNYLYTNTNQGTTYTTTRIGDFTYTTGSMRISAESDHSFRSKLTTHFARS
jgi:hypothetical protein